MSASELRAQARESLKGRWGQAILILVIYFIITFGLSFLLGLIPVAGKIVSLIISTPLSVGLISVYMKFSRGETIGYFDFINEAIELFGKAWGVVGHVLLKMLIPVILIVVATILVSAGSALSISSSIYSSSASSISASSSAGIILLVLGTILYIVSYVWGIIKGLLYVVANNILIDNPDMSTKDIVEESEKLMKGNRVRYFCFGLSFIGWIILASCTFGIGYLWLTPYMLVGTVKFYESLLGSSAKPAEPEKVEPSEPEVISNPEE